MNYSRRQLEALGEPLGEAVTRLKPGGRIYGGGGGGGQTVVSSSELPDWAKPYAKEVLGVGSDLIFNRDDEGKISGMKGYTPYEGNRIAGFSDLQRQAQKDIAGMKPSAYLGQGAGLASAAASGAMGMSYDPTKFTNQYKAPEAYKAGTFEYDKVGTQDFTQADMSKYMNPYMQNVVNIQKREAQRQADIMGQQNAAQAIQRGAFGGSGSAIIEAERQRNAMQQMNDIQSTGANQAWQQGMQAYTADQQRALQAALANQQAGITTQGMGEQSRQFGYGQGMNAAQLAAQYGLAADQASEQSRQFGSDLKMRGYGLGMQGAGLLGNIGQQEYSQNMGILQAKNQMGAEKQALRQRGLDQAYQEYLNQQNYPYKQLGFFSDMIRGLPLGQQSTRTLYDQPSFGQQFLSTAAGAYGLSRMADGGITDSSSVMDKMNDEGYLSKMMDKLTDEQLQQVMQHPSTQAEFRVAQEELASRKQEEAMKASEKFGLAGAFNNTPPEFQQQVFQAADGGIVAFAGGGKSKSAAEYLASAEDIDFETPPDRAAREKTIQEEREYIQRMMGPSATAPYLEELKAERAKGYQGPKAEGLAYLALAEGIGSERGFRGIAKGLGAFGRTMAQAKKEEREADRALRDSEMKLVMADQARSEGQFGKAYEFQNSAEKQRIEGLKLKQDSALKAAQVQGGLEQARIHAAAQRDAAARPTDLDKQTQRNYAALLETGAPANAQTMAKAAQQAASDLGRYPGDVRAGAGEMDRRLKAAEQIATAKLQDPAWREAKKNKDQEGMRIRENEMINELLGKQPGSSAAATTGGAPGTAAPAPAQAGTVPPAAIAKLAANPTAQNKAYFDQIFGAGAADRALKGK